MLPSNAYELRVETDRIVADPFLATGLRRVDVVRARAGRTRAAKREPSLVRRMRAAVSPLRSVPDGGYGPRG